MSVAGDICRKISGLQSAQIELLENITVNLGIVSDLAHAQVTVYARARDENFVVILAQVKPHTSFIQRKPSLLGSTLPIAEEPLIFRTFVSGESICGQREWALGMWMEMWTYPVLDNEGNIIAVISFESNSDEVRAEGHSILVESAYMLQLILRGVSNRKLFRPLSASDGILIIDEMGQIIFANAAAISIYKVLGVSHIVGRRFYDRHVDMRLVQKAIRSKEPSEVEIEAGGMTLVQRVIPIVNDTGQLMRVVVIVANVTEIKKKEKELSIKAAVIQEIHHRVKNNLQTIASLLRLQARRTKSQPVKAALRESVNRILSISVVHEFLSQQDAEFIDVAEVARNILDMVIQNMLEPDFNLQTIFNGNTVILASEKASSLALVINELIQNSIEHGFTGRREGVIGVDIATLEATYQIEIYDNGIGLPPDFNVQTSNSLGLQIVRTLIEEDLGGNFRLYSEQGTHACITIPREVEGGK
ncbi:hypothetical protein P22_2384 [Propionispora sp. 2/2-37]|uniref:sensor histidine kinase n=1 Tax=Propionispora sp. 2/2-37 TaxID=1677858 RepID=UPI0006BB907F|nr:histidine kinase N-terminal domain-containing protein [Propionispora sp. 2/2-37]CUH96294.1 hypothetical protein P22_2384 [Propionispora sp. 2/2-37]